MRFAAPALTIVAILVVPSVSVREATAQLCGEVTAPLCDGACPAMQACVPSGDGSSCRCQATQIPCGFLDQGPGCYGFCQVPDFPICTFDNECFCIPAFTPTLTPTETPPPTNTPEHTPTIESACTGDCGLDGQVTVEEIVRAVNIGLGTAPVSNCLAADPNRDGQVTVEEIVGAVTSALAGCPL
jgi:hypothetical protein